MTNTMVPKKKIRNTSGRKPKQDPAVHRYGIKLTGDENFRFRQMFEDSGLDCYSKFIYRLERRTIELVVLSKQIISLTQDYQRRWLQR